MDSVHILKIDNVDKRKRGGYALLFTRNAFLLLNVGVAYLFHKLSLKCCLGVA